MLSEWVITAGFVGVGLVVLVVVAAAIGWAIQDHHRNTHH